LSIENYNQYKLEGDLLGKACWESFDML